MVERITDILSTKYLGAAAHELWEMHRLNRWPPDKTPLVERIANRIANAVLGP
jgi:hypothetical protein